MSENVFRARLTMLRKERHLTQVQMAEKLGVSRPSYTCYEIGNAFPPIATLCKLADMFNVSLDYLVGRTDNPDIDAADPDNAAREVALLEKYRKLSPEKRAKIGDLIDLLGN